MQQLKMWFNQRLFNLGLYFNLLIKGDFPPKGWTTFAIRITILSMVVGFFSLGV